MSVGGVFIRFGGLALRILQFCVSGIGLGIFSYFLSVLADRDLNIRNRWLAVEGITGAATLYALLACIFILFLGGKTFFGFLGMVIDLLFVGAFIAVAWFTRHGANSCNGNVQTPLGDGPSDSSDPGYGANGFGFGGDENSTYFPQLHTACVFNTVVFATATIGIFLFLISAVWQVLMVRHHKKEKKFGPSPSNNYTHGSGKAPFWKRGRRSRKTKDVETVGAVSAGHHAHTHTHAGTGAVRHSHETGTTLGNNAYTSEPKYGEPGYGQPAYHGHQADTYHDRTTAGRF